jgi:bifunctional UDP-N-acetylglucosamine pyrophosphorylase / glucosamine-1-phosphate N-acetyltransferase
MKSPLPKVLHPLAGRPMVAYPVRAALDLGVGKVLVVTNSETRQGIESALSRDLPGAPVGYAVQTDPRGTGDAVRVALDQVGETEFEQVLVLCGDTPLIEASHLEMLCRARTIDLGFLSFEVDNPRGYGRVLRDQDQRPIAIVEERDIVDDKVRAIREVNAGVYLGNFGLLRAAVSRLVPKNQQNEFYLTDIVQDFAGRGKVEAFRTPADAVLGVNHRGELSHAEELLYARIRRVWGERGVTLVGRPLVDATVELGTDARIEDGVRLRGATRVETGAVVDVGCVVDDSVIEAEAHLKPYSVVQQSSVGVKTQIGPFAHLRPGSIIEAEAHIGNFVETKKTRVRRGAKANHLAYLGDGDVGERANIGAGVIFCNYDGATKQTTTIGEGVFIGSDSQLIAPVNVGKDAYVATGTTVTENIPEGAFVIGRSRAIIKEGYAEALRAKQKKQKKSS